MYHSYGFRACFSDSTFKSLCQRPTFTDKEENRSSKGFVYDLFGFIRNLFVFQQSLHTFYILAELGISVVNLLFHIFMLVNGAAQVFKGCHLLQLIFTDFDVQIMVYSSDHHDFRFLLVQL